MTSPGQLGPIAAEVVVWLPGPVAAEVWVRFLLLYVVWPLSICMFSISCHSLIFQLCLLRFCPEGVVYIAVELMSLALFDIQVFLVAF